MPTRPPRDPVDSQKMIVKRVVAVVYDVRTLLPYPDTEVLIIYGSRVTSLFARWMVAITRLDQCVASHGLCLLITFLTIQYIGASKISGRETELPHIAAS